MKTQLERRRKYFVDKKVQGALLRQLLGYWLLGSFALVCFLFVYQVGPHLLSGSGDPRASVWRQVGPLLIVSLAISPIVVISAVRFSNRFVGPVLRFRRALRELARGDVPTPITLRDKDYWKDIADDINRIAASLPNSHDANQIVQHEESVAV